jgi:alpha-beta hydrolase superfamily lysophospholipase
MIDTAKIEPSTLDHPHILAVLFHPRPEWKGPSTPPNACDLMIPVSADVSIGARFHFSEPSSSNLLFFHGNGEIVVDYDDIAPLFNAIGFNLLAVDYRGYGRSTGKPTVTGMLRDSHAIFHFTLTWLLENGYKGPVLVMGRSLGSASAIELAAQYEPKIDGLIIESGFSRVGPLLRLFGVDPERIGFKEEEGLRHTEKISSFHKPTLVIHAENDHLIPFEEGMRLYKACGAKDKTMLTIPGADHNNIFLVGMDAYLNALASLAKRIAESMKIEA